MPKAERWRGEGKRDGVQEREEEIVCVSVCVCVCVCLFVKERTSEKDSEGRGGRRSFGTSNRGCDALLDRCDRKQTAL